MTVHLAAFDAALTEAAASRQAQLHDLPEPDGDPVVTAQREALQQTLAEIAAARQRLTDGTFGTCVGCDQPIPAARLELRPWAGACVRCVAR